MAEELKEREAFELQAAMRGLDISMFTPPTEKEYRNPDTQSEWRGWKACAQHQRILAANVADPGAVAVPVEFVRFLLGDAKLDGYSFSDMHQVRVGKFWWRTELRALLANSEGGKKP